MISFKAEGSTNTTVPFSFKDHPHILFFILTVLLGIPTHLYMIRLILREGNGIATKVFNLSDSFCEIGCCLCYLAFVVATFIPNLFPLALFFQGLSMTGRPLFQCLMCVERYLAVVHPVTFLKYKPLRYRLFCCISVWILNICSCFCCLVIFLVSTMTEYVLFYLVQFLLYFSIQLFCLGAVLRALKRSGPGDRKKERDEENHMKRRAFNIILITTLATIGAYLPSIISGAYSAKTGQFNFALWFPSLVCSVLAGFVQPVLYLHQIGKISCRCFM